MSWNVMPGCHIHNPHPYPLRSRWVADSHPRPVWNAWSAQTFFDRGVLSSGSVLSATPKPLHGSVQLVESNPEQRSEVCFWVCRLCCFVLFCRLWSLTFCRSVARMTCNWGKVVRVGLSLSMLSCLALVQTSVLVRSCAAWELSQLLWLKKVGVMEYLR